MHNIFSGGYGILCIIDIIENTGKYTQAEIACIRYSYLSIRNDLGKILIIIDICTIVEIMKST